MLEPSLRLRSGGQSGVDRAALDFAIAHDIPYAGWCPLGGLAEDEAVPPGLRSRYPQLRETPSADARQRTAWNVRDADATLILVPQGRSERSPGTEFTMVCAQLLYERPVLEIPIPLAEPAEGVVESVREWIRESRARRDSGGAKADELDLNVAGPRQSQAPGIYDAAYVFLGKLFGAD